MEHYNRNGVVPDQEGDEPICQQTLGPKDSYTPVPDFITCPGCLMTLPRLAVKLANEKSGK